MKLLIAGLPAREAAALKIFAGMALPGWDCEVHAGRRGQPLPQADLVVADLAGLGLGAWSVHAEAELLTALHGRNAMLLLPAQDSSWQQLSRGAGQQQLLRLAKPYGSEQMREALLRLAPPRQSPARAMRADPPNPREAHAPPRPVQRGPHLVMAPRPPAPMPVMAPPRFTPPPAGHGIAPETVFPGLRRHPLLARLQALLALAPLASGSLLELRPTLRQALVIDPAQGWVGHNTHIGELVPLDAQPIAVNALGVRELTPRQAQERLERLGGQCEPLDGFLWRLADATLGPEDAAPACDALLRLRSFPGFTRLPVAGHLELQLAAICLRAPQTLSSLKAVFAPADHARIDRFALLATLAGSARLEPAPPQAAAPRRPRKARPASTAPQPGFFRALLRKLF